MGGRIADYAGRKRMFLVGLLGFAAASAIGGAAQNSATLFGARGPSAAIHGYHVAFWIGVGLIAAAFLAVLVLVNAGRNDNSMQPAAPAGGDAV